MYTDEYVVSLISDVSVSKTEAQEAKRKLNPVLEKMAKKENLTAEIDLLHDDEPEYKGNFFITICLRGPVDIHTEGRYIPATRIDPPEYPELVGLKTENDFCDIANNAAIIADFANSIVAFDVDWNSNVEIPTEEEAWNLIKANRESAYEWTMEN